MEKRIEHNGCYLYVTYPNPGDINEYYSNSEDAIDDMTNDVVEQCIDNGYDDEQTYKCLSYIRSEYENYSNWIGKDE
jgi:hypothetical protein